MERGGGDRTYKSMGGGGLFGRGFFRLGLAFSEALSAKLGTRFPKWYGTTDRVGKATPDARPKTLQQQLSDIAQNWAKITLHLAGKAPANTDGMDIFDFLHLLQECK